MTIWKLLFVAVIGQAYDSLVDSSVSTPRYLGQSVSLCFREVERVVLLFTNYFNFYLLPLFRVFVTVSRTSRRSFTAQSPNKISRRETSIVGLNTLVGSQIMDISAE